MPRQNPAKSNKLPKNIANLERRRKEFDDAGLSSRKGYKRPGSQTK